MTSVSAALAAGARGREGHIPGEGGLWVLIFGDLVVFAALFAVFLHYRADDPASFAVAQSSLTPAFGVTYALLLLTSSLLVAGGVRAVRRRRPVPWLFVGAVAAIVLMAISDSSWRIAWPQVHRGIQSTGPLLILVCILGRTCCAPYIGVQKQRELLFEIVPEPRGFERVLPAGISAQHDA